VSHHGSGCPSPRKAYLLKEELAMRIAQTGLTLDTKPRERKEITSDVARWVERQGMGRGLLTVYIPDTSASLLSGQSGVRAPGPWQPSFA
jgi:hypothetical protein